MSELKPCPFCGSEAEVRIVSVNDYGATSKYGCVGCGIWFYTRDKWNKREKGGSDEKEAG